MEFPSLTFNRRVGCIVFIFSLGLLLYELCLTRVLSVFFYYHTAFLAVSLAMLGVGAGGVWVYLFSQRLRKGMESWMLVGGLSVAFLPLLFGFLRFDHTILEKLWDGSFFWIFLLVSVGCLLPFLMGGVVWAWWFRAYKEDAATVYGWDLLGAAVGALLLVPVMEYLGGPAALLLCSALLLSSTCWAAWMRKRNTHGTIALIATVCVLIGMGIQLRYDPLAIQIDMAQNKKKTTQVLYKRWNAFSRVVLLSQQGWYRGMSEMRKAYWRGKVPLQREALIDINAFAPLVQFDGDLKKVQYLGDLVSNMGHHLLPKGRNVAILGPGGGKDVVGALLFAPKQVTGIEINPILVNEIVKKHSRRFTGDLYRHPNVRILLGDGRSTLRRLDKEKFDLVIANSVATWASHSSGAMNLAEHGLYTVESCGLYLDRLTKNGILSISVWDLHRHALPLRWLTTCEQAAKARGIPSLRDRIAVVGNRWDRASWFSTVLISRSPFTKEQEHKLRMTSKKLGFDLLYSPKHTENDKEFLTYFAAPQAFVRTFPFNIAPATDDQPFFLYTARWKDALTFWKSGVWEENAALVNLLLSLLLVCTLLLCVVGGPLLWKHWSQGEKIGLQSPEIAYFLAIGLGFMLIEIPLIQRFTLFLGHPTYALTVVLASILLYSGLGSLCVGRWSKADAFRRWPWILMLLCSLLLILRFALDPVLLWASAATTPMRIVFVLVLLLPFGFVMGMPLPLGMLYLGEKKPTAIPWAWGINGASSVVASVAALWLAALWGFQLVYSLAVCWYILAWWVARKKAQSTL